MNLFHKCWQLWQLRTLIHDNTRVTLDCIHNSCDVFCLFLGQSKGPKEKPRLFDQIPLCDFCGNWSFPNSLAGSMKQKLLHWDKMASPQKHIKRKETKKIMKKNDMWKQMDSTIINEVHMSLKRWWLWRHSFDMKRKVCLSEVITLNWYYLQIIRQSLMKEKQSWLKIQQSHLPGG